MFFKQKTNDDASISYFFGCGGQGVGIALDVLAGDEAWYIDQARRLNVEITHVFDSHIHADHLSGGRTLAGLAGAAYTLHESNIGKTGFPFTPVRDQQTIDAGNTRVRVLHTPGHTEDSICLLLSDRRRADAPWFILTGDTLFVGSVGRPDLAGREQEMAAKLWRSLHDRLLNLPDELEIFPGHQAGSACGADISGKPSSTIGFEKRWNALLSLEKDAFITALTATVPPRPAAMERLVAANLGQAAFA
ncbi:MBL fold metallo-hydrolase [Massilia glaciei]|uniref:MBL fold metallo-hydrolase n=1 Tax=Massilia glaciei TaxID=1524097 RepID=A0A2U2H911_9BURK|nr:MBL fold metallo-hydrolase [Massilia glaciei]PWF39106.1 MBL fold metallo-hydrolase [Massilia glaciei]